MLEILFVFLELWLELSAIKIRTLALSVAGVLQSRPAVLDNIELIVVVFCNIMQIYQKKFIQELWRNLSCYKH